MRLLGVDVDLTLVNTDEGWREFLANKYGYVKTPMVDYNFGVYYPNKDTYEYWRELDYSSYAPHQCSIEALEKLSQYFGIVFISSIKGNHTKSKYYWLKKHFPFMTGYVATKEKWVCNVEAMIDDRLDVLSKFPQHKRIQFDTIYTQDVECDVAIKFDKWNDEIVHKICEEYLK